jgi:hypothetical protein
MLDDHHTYSKSHECKRKHYKRRERICPVNMDQDKETNQWVEQWEDLIYRHSL